MTARAPRLAAGRARALGAPTRGTTAPQRLRRVDRWLTAVHGGVLTAAADPLVVDLGFGSRPFTTQELFGRLRLVRPDVRVVGLELDPRRVAAARPVAEPGLSFAVGGFELAGLRPAVVRAFNVLRQYPEPEAGQAWGTLRRALAPGGLLVEGTCDELGRLACWVALDADGPRTLTLAAHLASLARPGELAERLPKALIHRNVPGEPVAALMAELDRAWAGAATHQVFGPRQRWVAACDDLRWPRVTPRRARFGELTVPWESVAPAGG